MSDSRTKLDIDSVTNDGTNNVIDLIIPTNLSVMLFTDEGAKVPH